MIAADERQQESLAACQTIATCSYTSATRTQGDSALVITLLLPKVSLGNAINKLSLTTNIHSRHLTEVWEEDRREGSVDDGWPPPLQSASSAER